jgi:hypothetical protein
MQALLDNWVSNSQCNPVISWTDVPNFSDDWVSTDQSNPQLSYFHIAIAIGGSSSKANAGSIARSSANSSVNGVGKELYSIATATAVADSIDNGVGSFTVKPTVYPINIWVSDSQIEPAFVTSADYFKYWVADDQSSPQGTTFYTYRVGDTMFFGMI